MKYFISYTIRDGLINKNKLKKVEKIYSQKGLVYIDLLHNNSKYPQIRVFKELFSSNAIVIINSPKIMDSPWVKLEILLAKIRRMKFININIEDIEASCSFKTS